MINKKFIISTLFFALSTSALPGQLPLKFPSLEDELFKIPDGINPLRIPLKFINMVVKNYLYFVYFLFNTLFKPTIKMAVGTPKQEFMAIFDTATPITYIISDKVYPCLKQKKRHSYCFYFFDFST
jgi:hypothetical protein